MTTIVHPWESDFTHGVALCEFCARQRASAPGARELVAVLDAIVSSGACHDCGAGFCICGDACASGLCPRRNAPVVVTRLGLYRVVIPDPPETLRAVGVV